MDMDRNIEALGLEMAWLVRVINQVITSYLKQEGHEMHWQDLALPDLPDGGIYTQLVENWQLDIFERLTLSLAIAPHFKPETLDIFFGVNQMIDRSFSEFGGVTDKAFNGFLPTGQTLIFLIAANNPLWRSKVINIFSNQHRFAQEQIISLESSDSNLPGLSGVLCLSDQWFHYFLTGENVKPELSSAFPASPITTPLEWSDLVLDYAVMSQVEELRHWLTYGQTLMEDWGLKQKVKPGYRAVFYGPPGTGKTLTAALLGKSTGREVYRVDLSMIVSKYIGETEKNLSKVFDAASHKDWILFFDEADALFGKRTTASTANDRHSNQQTGYLLQRLEDFPGTVILATNLQSNMDEAFTRRFQTMINFTMPAPRQRLQIWKNIFSGICELDSSVNLEKIAEEHELAGGAIINVLRQCSLSAISRDTRVLFQDDIMSGIKRELKKENKTLRAN